MDNKQDPPPSSSQQQKPGGAPAASSSHYCLTGAASLNQAQEGDERSQHPDGGTNSGADGGVEQRMSITIKNIMEGGGEAKSVTVRKCANIKELKEEIFELTEIPVESQTLVYKETLLEEDDRSLSDYGIVHLSTVNLTPKMNTGLMASRSSASQASTANSLSVITEHDIIRYLLGPQDKEQKTSPSTSAESADKRTQKEVEDDNSKMKDKMRTVMQKRKQFRKGTFSQPATPVFSPAAQSPKLNATEDEESEMSETEREGLASGPSGSGGQQGSFTNLDQRKFFDPAETVTELREKTIKYYEPSETLGDLMNRRVQRFRVGCSLCKARLTVVERAIKCRCEKCFCAKHRNPESHSCSYDYKTTGRQKIAEDNPKIVARKEGKDSESVRDPETAKDKRSPSSTEAAGSSSPDPAASNDKQPPLTQSKSPKSPNKDTNQQEPPGAGSSN